MDFFVTVSKSKLTFQTRERKVPKGTLPVPVCIIYIYIVLDDRERYHGRWTMDENQAGNPGEDYVWKPSRMQRAERRTGYAILSYGGV